MLGNTIALIAVAAMFGIEAYKAPDRLVRIVLTLLAVVFAMSGVLLQQISTVWPAVGGFIASIFTTPSSWFVLLMGLFFVVRPYWARMESQPTTFADPYDDAKLRAEVADLAKTVRAVIDDYQRMSGLEARFSDMLDGLKKHIAQRGDTVAANHAALQDRVVVVEATHAKFVAETATLRHLDAQSASERFENMYLALVAIYHRERLRELAAEIHDRSIELRAATLKGARYDLAQWETWGVREHSWMGLLRSWCELAAVYLDGVSDRVLTVTEGQFREGGVATIDQFPEHTDAFIVYKGFCARWKNFLDWEGEVDRAIHQAAFNAGGRRPFADAPLAQEKE